MQDIDKKVEACRFQEIQEVIKVIEPGRNGSKSNIARSRTASLFCICSASAKSTGASDALYGKADCLLSNKPTRKAIIRFCKHDKLEDEEPSVSFVVRPDAVMTD